MKLFITSCYALSLIFSIILLAPSGKPLLAEENANVVINNDEKVLKKLDEALKENNANHFQIFDQANIPPPLVASM